MEELMVPKAPEGKGNYVVLCCPHNPDGRPVNEGLMCELDDGVVLSFCPRCRLLITGLILEGMMYRGIRGAVRENYAKRW